MVVIDLFAGCGGLSLGLQKAGFIIKAAYDNWEPAVEVYKKNFNHPIHNVDLTNISDVDTKRIKKMNIDVIAGGPPCQDFSSAGKRNDQGDNANLTKVFAYMIYKVKPKFFIMENVDLVKNSKKLEAAFIMFKEAGYGLTCTVLNSSYYGVPQNRKRFFVVGELYGQDMALLKYLETRKNENPMTVREYLGSSLGIEFYYRHPRSYQRRAVFSIDEPSPTVRGVNRPIPPNYKKHPGDKADISNNVRPLTTIERSYIQTFPKSFIFDGTKSDLEQMIGNAVPVNLAKHVGDCLLKYIKEKSEGKVTITTQMSLK